MTRYYEARRGWVWLGDGGRWQPVRLPVTQRTRRMQAVAAQIAAFRVRLGGRADSPPAVRTGSTCGPSAQARPPVVTGSSVVFGPWQSHLGPAAPAAEPVGSVRGLRERYPGRQAERFGMGLAVVLGGDLAEAGRPGRLPAATPFSLHLAGLLAIFRALSLGTGGNDAGLHARLPECNAGRPKAACCSRRLRRALTFRCGGGHWQHRPAAGGPGVGPEGSSVPGAPPSPRPALSQGRLAPCGRLGMLRGRSLPAMSSIMVAR